MITRFLTSRPPCVVGLFPIRVDKLTELTLPGVAEADQVFVTDPRDPRWFFVCRTVDVPELHDWLEWYHRASAPVLSLFTEPRPSDSRCGS